MSVEVLQHPESETEGDAVYSMLPRPFAWVLGFDHSAVWLGAAIAASYLIATAAVIAAEGIPSALGWAELVTAIVIYALYFAGVPIAIAVLVRGLERDVRDLAPVMAAEEGGEASLRREALTIAPRAVWLGVGAGVLVATQTLWVFLSLEGMYTGVLSAVFLILREVILDGALFGAMGWVVGATMRLSQLTEERARPDLLDPSAFAALARNGARLAGVWLVFMALGVPVILVVSEALAESLRSVLLMTLALACFAVVALILPSRGAHRVLRAAKRTELEEVRSQIAEARRTREDTRLPGLLAWEARMKGLSEWPIDATALRRTGLFLLLPLASWVGSALVERLVDLSLG